MRGRPGHARRLYERALQLDGRYDPALQNLKAISPNRMQDEPEKQPEKKSSSPQEEEP
jgi:hypothetical protein